jgi:hypothetical protein
MITHVAENLEFSLVNLWMKKVKQSEIRHLGRANYPLWMLNCARFMPRPVQFSGSALLQTLKSFSYSNKLGKFAAAIRYQQGFNAQHNRALAFIK